MIPFQLHRRIPLVRRPFFQRDQIMRERDNLLKAQDALRGALNEEVEKRNRAIVERDAAIAERNRVSAERDELIVERDRINAQAEREEAERPTAPFARSLAPESVDDAALVTRIIAAYRASFAAFGPSSNSFWEGAFFDLKRDVHETLMAGEIETVQKMLRDPGSTDLFYGFENHCRSINTAAIDQRDGSKISYGLLQKLTDFAAAFGLCPLTNPEPSNFVARPELEGLLSSLDDAFGMYFQFPNPFSGEIGLPTSRGIASERAIQATYQAARVASLVKPGARVLEIGAGLGRTAYYASAFGIRDYTIIDIPLTAVAQAYFLGCTLGPDAVCLFGEDRPGIRVLSPPAFLKTSERYDLILNVDSLTELDPQVAKAYCATIREAAGIFLSINHEANSFTAREACATAGMVATSRSPYWMRPGYVEEIFRNA